MCRFNTLFACVHDGATHVSTNDGGAQLYLLVSLVNTVYKSWLWRKCPVFRLLGTGDSGTAHSVRILLLCARHPCCYWKCRGQKLRGINRQTVASIAFPVNHCSSISRFSALATLNQRHLRFFILGNAVSPSNISRLGIPCSCGLG